MSRDGTERVTFKIRGSNGLIKIIGTQAKNIIGIQEHSADPFCTIVTKDCSIKAVSLYEDVIKQLSVATQTRLELSEIKYHVKRHK